MDEIDKNAERIGKMASAIFLILLIGLFAYGYLWPVLAG
jgi:hypothetical protein